MKVKIISKIDYFAEDENGYIYKVNIKNPLIKNAYDYKTEIEGIIVDDDYINYNTTNKKFIPIKEKDIYKKTEKVEKELPKVSIKPKGGSRIPLPKK